MLVIKPSGKRVNTINPIYEAGKARWHSSPVGNLSSLKSMEDFVTANSAAHNSLSVFSESGFSKRGAYVDVTLEVDMNKVQRHEYRWLIKAFKELQVAPHQQLVIKNTPVQEKAFRILLKNHQAFRGDYDRGTNEYTKTHEYEYEGPIQTERLDQFLKREGEGMDMNYRSGVAPEKHFYSKKIVGSTFEKEIQEKKGDQAMMMISKGCHGCKVAGKQVEQIAKDSIANDAGITFSRMDSDLNKLSCHDNFAYTPVIMLFKEGHKQKAYQYRSPTIIKGQLRDFFYITSAFSMIDMGVF